MRKPLIILFVLFLSIPLLGQYRTGNIHGIVTDEEGSPLPGVTVTLTGSKTAPMTQVTSAEGKFRFLSLFPEIDYVIKMELGGFKTKIEEGIIVRVGRNTNLKLTMEMGAIEEEVTVTAVSPVVDPKKTEISQTMTYQALQSLPTSRDPWVIIQMVPFVQVNRENVGGNVSGQQSTFTAAGGQPTENTWTIDGVDITDRTAMGSSPTYYDFDVIEEMHVTVGGTDVETQAGGIALNMVTRRGGNRVSLGGRFFYTESGFQAIPSSNIPKDGGLDDYYDPVTDTWTGISPTLWDEMQTIFGEGLGYNRIRDIKDFGFNIGGPVIKDKLWWWGSYGIQEIKTDVITGTADDTYLNNYAFKVNLQLVPENRFEFFIKSGDKKQFGRNASTSFPSGYNQHGKYHFGSPIMKFQVEHMFGPNLFVSAKFGFRDSGFGAWPANDEDLQEMLWYNWADKVNERSYFWFTSNRPNKQITLHATYFNEDILDASHEIKVGFEYSHAKDSLVSGYPGNMRAWYNYNVRTVDWSGIDPLDPDPGVRDVMIDDFGIDLRLLRFFRGTTEGGPEGCHYWSGFLQDVISFGRFNLKLGLRYDYQVPYTKGSKHDSIFLEDTDARYLENYYEIQNRHLGPGVPAAINNLMQGTVIPEVKTSDTINWKFFSPRVGITWDVNGDGKTLAKLSGAIYGGRMKSSYGWLWQRLGSGGNIQFWWWDQDNDEVATLNELYWAEYTSARTAYPAFDALGNFVGNWAREENYMWWGYDYTDPTATSDPRYQIDPNWSADRTYEVLLTLEKEIFTDFAVALDLTWRRYNNRWVYRRYSDSSLSRLIERTDYVPAVIPIPSSYTDPATSQTIDLGDAAGRTWYVWDASVEDVYERYVANTPKDNYDQYWGINIRVNKRLSNNWMLSGSVTWQDQKNYWGETFPLNPSNQWATDGKPYAYTVFEYGLFSRWMIKAQGLYQLPFDFNISFTFNAREGYILPHTITISDPTNPNPSSFSVDMYTEIYGQSRLPTFWNLDLRLEKVLRMGDIGRIYFMMDAFNVFNNNILLRQREANPGIIYLDTGTFAENVRSGEPREVLNPRIFRFGVRFQF